ncbi:MAG: hypothetical protein G01um101418_517 [Parcubacteria group bacterium Gr01-1014_18]|nr:MAG: hypothetical protein Greene041636_563 [Parcubacteria group bacterium Greene0416_36]TSC80980.1 MAG: hypothetical protein G01um101418_517 [Parcubacteria group bacterium Gr01-1014_18]TSC98867.1 MAG: hypothetical protein Greene101420_500 [Parcubacteria group bacterium Greene1014_20]TSD06547.1 MAG: hypothetical protein Greene07142_822 [Parcubacteria group bacterium Greene0714_2]
MEARRGQGCVIGNQTIELSCFGCDARSGVENRNTNLDGRECTMPYCQGCWEKECGSVNEAQTFMPAVMNEDSISNFSYIEHNIPYCISCNKIEDLIQKTVYLSEYQIILHVNYCSDCNRAIV